MKVYHIDAFSKTPGMGNPAGVVVDADLKLPYSSKRLTYEA
ncbi:hypothetical protein [Cohnella yongneupensis]|uniref:PhzF family phenazine biosynthesis protein n=1 Tax=Cohnella yongneupensis TaxID=425006 RepID=A0ABW0QU04_9BACL